MLVVALGEVCHHVLAALRQLPHNLPWRPGDPENIPTIKTTLLEFHFLPAKGGHHGLWGEDGPVLDVDTISDGTPPAYHTVLPDVDVGVDDCSIDDAALTDEDVISYL